jgi:Spy/CpxP family protein refolding chaperone
MAAIQQIEVNRLSARKSTVNLSRRNNSPGSKRSSASSSTRKMCTAKICPGWRNHRGRLGFKPVPPMNRHLMRLPVVAALAAGFVFAQAPSTTTQPGSGRAAVRRRIAQALNLTDAQKQQAQAIVQQTRQAVQPLRQQAKQNRQALMAAIQAVKSDVEIHQLALTQGNLAGQLVAARAEALAKFYSMLTPEQRAKAALMRQRVRQMIEQRIQQRLSQRGNG